MYLNIDLVLWLQIPPPAQDKKYSAVKSEFNYLCFYFYYSIVTIVIEPTKEFEEIPEAWQEVARKYMLGREFNSLEEVFNQRDGRGVFVLSNFYVGEKRVIPNNLPYTITEVDIIARWSDSHLNYERIALKAKIG